MIDWYIAEVMAKTLVIRGCSRDALCYQVIKYTASSYSKNASAVVIR